MKKLLAFLISAFAINHAFAQNSNLTISTTGTTNLKISFAGKKYSLQDRTVTFQSLQPGNYPLTIFQLRKKADGGLEYANVFDRNITLTANKHTEICILRFGKASFDENYIEKDDWNENATNPWPSDYGPGNQTANRLPQATITQFTSVKNAINSEYSDADKLRMAKVVIRNYSFSTIQLKELCNLLYSDSFKLEFAKMAYDYCYDPANYYTLADVIYSSSVKKDLLDYLGNK